MFYFGISFRFCLRSDISFQLRAFLQVFECKDRQDSLRFILAAMFCHVRMVVYLTEITGAKFFGRDVAESLEHERYFRPSSVAGESLDVSYDSLYVPDPYLWVHSRILHQICNFPTQ